MSDFSVSLFRSKKSAQRRATHRRTDVAPLAWAQTGLEIVTSASP